MATAKRDTRSIPLEIRASISQPPAELPGIIAYAFSQGGALLDMQSLDKSGNTMLGLPVGKVGQAVRVVLGPEMDKDGLDVGELLRRGGVDAHVALRPGAEKLAPLTFDIVDTWMKRSLGGCQYFVAHPGGLNYESFPVNSYEAESRRLSRFTRMGHTPGLMSVPPASIDVPGSREFPFTLDLRRQL